jgi:hypothetical protein
MIISDKQQQANQQNAQHSTGPKSPEGKAAIRFNALTHGLRTRATILPGENAEDYYKLWDELEADSLLSKTGTNITTRVANGGFACPELEF